MKNLITTVFPILLLGLPGCSQMDLNQETVLNEPALSVQEKMLHRRAIETAVWAMPMTNTLAMRDGLGGAGCKFNNVCYFSEIQTWRAAVTTPNNTTPYIFAFWNIKDGPVMIEVPPIGVNVGLWGTLMDVWQRPLADVGAKGRDKGEGAKYLIVADNYDGDTFGADYVLKQKTLNGYTLLRPIIPDSSPASLKIAEEFTRKLKIYYADSPAATTYVDLQDAEIDGVVHFDFSLYEMIDRAIQEENLEQRDAVALGMLRGIGIEKGESFNPSEKQKAIFNNAAAEALAYLQDTYFDNSPKASLGNGWVVLTPASSYETVFDWVVDSGAMALDDRGSSYFAFFSSAEEFNLTNPPTMYLLTGRDAEGKKLMGDDTYKFNVPANVPVRQFWSVLIYDYQDATFLNNVDKYGVASSEDLSYNEDGSVDVYFGPTRPEGVEESNYVPTIKGKGWFPYFRFYGPEPALFKGEFKLNKIERLE